MNKKASDEQQGDIRRTPIRPANYPGSYTCPPRARRPSARRIRQPGARGEVIRVHRCPGKQIRVVCVLVVDVEVQRVRFCVSGFKCDPRRRYHGASRNVHLGSRKTGRGNANSIVIGARSRQKQLNKPFFSSSFSNVHVFSSIQHVPKRQSRLQSGLRSSCKGENCKEGKRRAAAWACVNTERGFSSKIPTTKNANKNREKKQ